jgi:acyl-CoA synthetase (AMP-forming)/AMP-acid ligase II
VVARLRVAAGGPFTSGARQLVSGSAALPTPVFNRLSELTGHQPVERYGMTETLITVSGRADGERRVRLGRHPAGRGGDPAHRRRHRRASGARSDGVSGLPEPAAPIAGKLVQHR